MSLVWHGINCMPVSHILGRSKYLEQFPQRYKLDGSFHRKINLILRLAPQQSQIFHSAQPDVLFVWHFASILFFWPFYLQSTNNFWQNDSGCWGVADRVVHWQILKVRHWQKNNTAGFSTGISQAIYSKYIPLESVKLNVQ